MTAVTLTCDSVTGVTGSIENPVSEPLGWCCFGPNALKIYNGVEFVCDEERSMVENILEKLDEFTICSVNENYENIYSMEESRGKANR